LTTTGLDNGTAYMKSHDDTPRSGDLLHPDCRLFESPVVHTPATWGRDITFQYLSSAEKVSGWFPAFRLCRRMAQRIMARVLEIRGTRSKVSGSMASTIITFDADGRITQFKVMVPSAQSDQTCCNRLMGEQLGEGSG